MDGIHSIKFGFRGDLKERIKAFLNHSITYQSLEIVTAICAWIQNTASSKDDANR